MRKRCGCGRPILASAHWCASCVGRLGGRLARERKARAVAKEDAEIARRARWNAAHYAYKIRVGLIVPHPIFAPPRQQRGAFIAWRRLVLVLVELLDAEEDDGRVFRSRIRGDSPAARRWWERMKAGFRQTIGVGYETGPTGVCSPAWIALTEEGRDRALVLVAEYDKWNSERRLK